MKLILLFMTFLICETLCASKHSPTKNDDTYKAAVVEYHPYGESIFDHTDNALTNYLEYISYASNQSAQIIVFPEMTLNPDTPVTIPDEGIKHFEGMYSNYSRLIQNLSDAAINEKIYVVVNMAERVPCDAISSCSQTADILFNTNVVFDDNGVIISKYRKINLFVEPGFTPSQDHKLGIFETSFGVKFGHFICFDILFQQPAVEILQKEYNITNIIFPTMWFSELPFFSAVQIQESWAYTHNVNLLVAGANIPSVGSTGTGIYSGRNGKVVATMNSKPLSQMLIATIPKIVPDEDETIKIFSETNIDSEDNGNKTAQDMNDLTLKQEDLTYYNTKLIDSSENFTLEHGQVECIFNVTMETLNIPQREGKTEYKYRAIAFDGVRSFEVTTAGVTNCAIVACTTDDLKSCAKRFQNYTNVQPTRVLRKIEISATVIKPTLNETFNASNIVYHPVTLKTNILPIDVTQYKYNVTEHETISEKLTLKMTLKNYTENDILTFGIMGRVFERDGQPIPNACRSYTGSISTILAAMVSLLLMRFN